jgi:ABC-type nitrate/sulfonate/bicarbonate transport system substrate-binding protein
MADDQAPPTGARPEVAFDWQSYASSPKYFSQYAVANVSADDVALAFCVKVPGIVEERPGDIGLTQATVFMSLGHFQRFAAMVADQAAQLNEALTKGFAEAVKKSREEADNAEG